MNVDPVRGEQLTKITAWWLGSDSNPLPFGCVARILPDTLLFAVALSEKYHNRDNAE